VNKRFVSSDIYLPSLWSPSIGGLVIGIDTSGSMGQEELNQAASEITAIVEDFRPEWVLVLYCNYELVGVQRFEQGEDIQLTAKGGGGTRFKPVFDYIEEEINEPIAALVYFTDLYGDTSELDQPEYPVIWGATCNSRVQVPFGDVVQAY
jgi:predicted metal-dependent peptidase